MISAHTISADVQSPALSLDVKRAQVMLDESRYPYATATLTCAAADEAVLAQIDPRAGVRVRLLLMQRYGDGEPLSALTAAYAGQTLAALTTKYSGKQVLTLSADYGHPYNGVGMLPSTFRRLDLALRSRSVDPVSGEMTLSLASDETLAGDVALLASAPLALGTTSVRSAVGTALSRIGTVLATGTADGTVLADATTWQPGTSVWDFANGLATAVGLRLYCDEARIWHLEPEADGSSGGVTLTPYLTRATDTLARDASWYDAVVVKYDWVDAANVRHVVYDTAGDGMSSRVLRIEKSTAYPGPGAAALALSFYQGRGRVVDARAVCRYDVTPGFTVTIDTDAMPIQTGLITSVAWALPEDEMDVASRDLVDTPPTAWVFTSAGTSWSSVATGVTWSTYTAA